MLAQRGLFFAWRKHGHTTRSPQDIPAGVVVRKVCTIRNTFTGEVMAEGAEPPVLEPAIEWVRTHEIEEIAPPARRAGSRYEEALVLECAYLRSKVR